MKIIELLNLIANKEILPTDELPFRFVFKNNIYSYTPGVDWETNEWTNEFRNKELGESPLFIEPDMLNLEIEILYDNRKESKK